MLIEISKVNSENALIDRDAFLSAFLAELENGGLWCLAKLHVEASNAYILGSTRHFLCGVSGSITEWNDVWNMSSSYPVHSVAHTIFYVESQKEAFESK